MVYPFTVQFSGVFSGVTVTCNRNLSLNVALFPCGQGAVAFPANFIDASFGPYPFSLKTFTQAPDGSSQTVVASAPAGMYHTVYKGGAYKSPQNPCPDPPSPHFKLVLFTFFINGSIDLIGTNHGGFLCDTTVGGVEALMPIGDTINFSGGPTPGGAITINGVLDPGFTCGSCPSWEFIRDQILLPEPTLLRIHNYSAIAAQFICPTCCLPDVPVLGGGPTEWNGSFGSASIYAGTRVYSNTTFSERNDNFVAQNISIDGRILWSVRCLAPKTGAQIEADLQLAANNHIIPGTLNQNQNFWYFSIWSLKSGFIFEIIWAGVKAYGTDPTGTYARVDACDPAGSPTCVTLDGSNNATT